MCFTIFNFIRSLAIASGALNSPILFYEVKIVTYVLFLAVALGMAFGFFWMTVTIPTANLEQMASAAANTAFTIDPFLNPDASPF
jgi:hypothetical protein